MTRLSPRALVVVTVAAVLAVVAMDAPPAIIAIGAAPVIVVLRDATVRRVFGRRLLLAAPVASAAVAARWLGHAPVRETWCAALRIIVALAWSTWLTRALKPRELDAALRSLGLPAALVELVAQTRRFAAQLVDTLGEAWSAAALRGGLSTLRATTRTAGCVAGVLVVRALDRSERVATAALLRGSGLDLRVERPQGDTTETSADGEAV